MECGVFQLGPAGDVVPDERRNNREQASFAIGVFHAGWDWIAYGGNKGAMTGSFLTGVHQDLGVTP